MKAVFDTNILVAAFLAEGVCTKLLRRARKGECELILSRDIMAEFEATLRTKFSLSQREITEVRTLVTEAAREIVERIAPVPPLCRDPYDDKVLACAKAVDADYIVTGDNDLLVIKKYGKAKIVTPREFEALCSD